MDMLIRYDTSSEADTGKLYAVNLKREFRNFDLTISTLHNVSLTPNTSTTPTPIGSHAHGPHAYIEALKDTSICEA